MSCLLRAWISNDRSLRFRRWQTFRAMDATDALVLVFDWDSAETLQAALSLAEVRACVRQAAARGHHQRIPGLDGQSQTSNERH